MVRRKTFDGLRVTFAWIVSALFILSLAVPLSYAEDAPEPIPSALLEFADAVMANGTGQGVYAGHHAGVVEYPRDALLLRIHLIRAARQSIDLQTFMWEGDESARLVGYELIQAARRGVRVRVLVDGAWSATDIDEISFAETTYPSIDFRVYRPAARRIESGPLRKFIHWITPNGTNQRMHAKVMVVDGVIGLTGGRNIGNKYFGMSTANNFKDREVLVVGPQVASMSLTFEQYWNFKHAYPSHRLKDVAERMESGQPRTEITREVVQLDTLFAGIDRDSLDSELVRERFVETLSPVNSLEFVADLPGRKTVSAFLSYRTSSRMTNRFNEILGQTQRELLMQSPYVIFNRRARMTFRKHYAHAPDLRVRISTNSLAAADHMITYAANFRLRTKVVLGLGFEVYEMRPHPAIQPEHLPGFEELEMQAVAEGAGREPYLCVHAKTYVFDGRVTYIGTMNLDPRSYYYNSECGVFIEDERFAEGMRETLLREMSAANSWVIARKQLPLGFVNRFIEAISSALPVDPWPLRNTSSFELLPGAEEVGPLHPEFYDRYEDVGSFPGTVPLDSRRLWTNILKTFGKATTPLL